MPALSIAQRRLFGMVRAYQKGQLKHPSKKIKDIAGGISAESAGHYAKTKEDELPEHVTKESMTNTEKLFTYHGIKAAHSKEIDPATNAAASLIPMGSAVYSGAKGGVGQGARTLGREMLESGIGTVAGGGAGAGIGALAGKLLSKNPEGALVGAAAGAVPGMFTGSVGGMLHGAYRSAENYNDRHRMTARKLLGLK